MYKCKGAVCSYVAPSLSHFHRHCQRCRHVPADGEGGNTRRLHGVRGLQLSIEVPEVSNIEVGADEGSPFDMGNIEGEMVHEEVNDNDVGGAGGYDAPLKPDIADIRSAVASMAGDLTLSSILEIIHESSLDLNVFRNRVRSCIECREIVQRGVERSIFENGFEIQVTPKEQE